MKPTPSQERDHLRNHLDGIKRAALRWLNRPARRVATNEAVRHLRNLAITAMKPFEAPEPKPHPELQDLEKHPMVEDLDPEETQDPATHVYEIETGATYWVIAHEPAHALEILGKSGWIDGVQGWLDECGPGTGAMTIEVPTIERLNRQCFYDEHAPEPAHRRMAAEYNRDPSPRVMACSEW